LSCRETPELFHIFSDEDFRKKASSKKKMPQFFFYDTEKDLLASFHFKCECLNKGCWQAAYFFSIFHHGDLVVLTTPIAHKVRFLQKTGLALKNHIRSG